MTHTPGPWSLLPYPEGKPLISVIAGEPTCKNGITQATWIAELDRDNLDGEEGENEANARLIAAAPDMLAALRRAYSFILCNGYDAQDQALLNEISAAIAKAEGSVAVRGGDPKVTEPR